MSHELIDVRTPLAITDNVRVEIGRDGVIHVLVGPVTLHVDRSRCEELTTTLAHAMLVLARREPKKRPRTKPALRLVTTASEEETEPGR